MHKFPDEFEALLSRAGRRVLAGTHPECGALADPRRRFVALDGLIDRAKAAAARALLDRMLYGALAPLADPIPPETIWAMTEDYDEWLPKCLRLKTAYLERRGGRAYAAAKRSGLATLLRSESFASFAAALAGRKLRNNWGVQVLCYGPGDYSGPHNDHHPENPAAQVGYLDIHIGLSSPSVAHQWLVHAKSGHFTEIANVAKTGMVTAYRLPFWHYTTPLVAKSGRAATARRWVLLGTFLFAGENTKPQACIVPPACATARA